MLLLVIDTSGKNGSVALARQSTGHDEVEMIDSVPLAGGTFSAQLIPQIADLLSRHSLRKDEIDTFIAVSGPGSFTGLRVGLAAVKALAEILQKPIVPVSLLEVLVVSTGKQGRVAAALDAGRGQVYLGQYEITGEAACLLEQGLLSKENLPDAVRGMIFATTDLSLAAIARSAAVQVEEIEAIQLRMIADLGVRRLHAGATVSAEQLDANYIRRSDEIFGKPASGS
jgi:tRNA threonylcarbamoyladenosine biosynthesis protein TsaB